MKKNISVFCLTASLLLILDSFGAGRMIMLFLLAGVIPGTNIVLPPELVLLLVIVAACLLIVSLFSDKNRNRHLSNA
jgi:membrane protein implicated in regulation of membrane protease activity